MRTNRLLTFTAISAAFLLGHSPPSWANPLKPGEAPSCHTLDGKPCQPLYDESDEGGAADQSADEKDIRSGRYEHLHSAGLHGFDLRHAHLKYTDLSSADLSAADLRYADAQHADFHNANLIGADFRGADLRGADLRGANLRDASFTGANMCGAKVEVADLMLAGKFTREDMRGVKLDWSDAAIDWRPNMYKSEKKRYAAMRRYWRVTYSCAPASQAERPVISEKELRSMADPVPKSKRSR